MKGYLFAFVIFIASLLAVNGSVLADPCAPRGNCTVPAPVCVNYQVFQCDQAGVWFANSSVTLNHSMVIAGPVRIEGDLILLRGANMTWTTNHKAFLSVWGTANMTAGNSTWLVNVSKSDLDLYAKLEDQKSSDRSTTQRRIFEAKVLVAPENWKLKLTYPITCNHPFLDQPTPSIVNTTVNGTTGETFVLTFYAKSECWWWSVFIGAILGFFAIPIIAIILFRTVPALVEWTAPIAYNTNHVTVGHLEIHNEYEMETKPRSPPRANQLVEDEDNIQLDY